ncbi:MAG TPA: AsnC family protein, partial [Syntrophaceae bacterium]|nr:AsnC family protein [Syntrophaceae bacterium]
MKKILILRREGKSLRAIGRALGISHVAVLKRLKKCPSGNQCEDKIIQNNEAVDQAERENQKSGYNKQNKPSNNEESSNQQEGNQKSSKPFGKFYES